MNAMCFPGMAGLPVLPWDLLRQNSRNFLFLHRITVSGFTMISSVAQSLQTFESSERENPQPCHPVEPPEDNQIERLHDHDHK